MKVVATLALGLWPRQKGLQGCEPKGSMGGAYRRSSFLGRHPCYFGHYVFMCSSLTFLFHTDNTFFFFFPISFDGFWQWSYVGMWGHYGSRIMGIFSRPLVRCHARLLISFGGVSFLFMGECALIYFSKELGFSGSVFVF